MDCPFCMPKVYKMVEGTASTQQFEEGFYLACPACGFSMTARSKAVLVNAHNTLWDYFPDSEAV